MNYIFDFENFEYDDNTICSMDKKNGGIRLISQDTPENRAKMEDNIEAYGHNESIIKFSKIVEDGYFDGYYKPVSKNVFVLRK